MDKQFHSEESISGPRSGAKVMCPDLFRGLDLKNEDLSKYDTLLVGWWF